MPSFLEKSKYLFFILLCTISFVLIMTLVSSSLEAKITIRPSKHNRFTDLCGPMRVLNGSVTDFKNNDSFLFSRCAIVHGCIKSLEVIFSFVSKLNLRRKVPEQKEWAFDFVQKQTRLITSKIWENFETQDLGHARDWVFILLIRHVHVARYGWAQVKPFKNSKLLSYITTIDKRIKRFNWLIWVFINSVNQFSLMIYCVSHVQLYWNGVDLFTRVCWRILHSTNINRFMIRRFSIEFI